MKKKFAFAIILVITVLLSCAFVACDDGKETGQDEEGLTQRLVLPEFGGEKVSYDKAGILTELNNYAFTQTILPDIEIMLQDSKEVNAIVSQDNTAVKSYEEELNVTGFTYGGEFKVESGIVKYYYNTFYNIKDDVKIYTTQNVYIMLDGEQNIILYYEDEYTQVFYSLPDSDETKEFGFTQFPDLGDGVVLLKRMDEYHPFGKVASMEITLQAPQNWYDGFLNILYEAGYEDSPYAENYNGTDEKRHELIWVSGKNLYEAQLYAYRIGGNKMEVHCMIYNGADEIKNNTGNNIWFVYDEASYVYDCNIEQTQIDEQGNTERNLSGYTASISFNDSFISIQRYDFKDREVNAEYYDIDEKNCYLVVNRGNNKELNNYDNEQFAMYYYYKIDELTAQRANVTELKATGATQVFKGTTTLYEYTGKYYDIDNNIIDSSITFWKDENDIVYALESEVKYKDYEEKRSYQITRLLTECGGNQFENLPIAYEPVDLPYNIITDYYGKDVMLDEIQGASGYYVEYIEEISWDEYGAEIKEIVPKLFALGVSDEELSAHKAMLSQKYTQIDEDTWSLKVSAEKTCYLTLRYEYMQNGEQNLMYEFFEKYLIVPNIFKENGASAVEIEYEIYSHFGSVDRYLFVKKDNYFIIYNVADFTDTVEEDQEKFVSYNIRIAVKKTGEDSYCIVNSLNYEEIGRVLSLEEVIDRFSYYGYIFTFNSDNLVQNGSVEIYGTQAIVYENRDNTGNAFTRYAYSEKYGVLLQFEDILDGNWNYLMKTLSVGAYKESLKGAGVLPDKDDLYVYEMLHSSVSGETRTLKCEDFSIQEFESYLAKIENNGLYIYHYRTGIEYIAVSAIDRGYYYLNIMYYTKESRIEITENLALESQAEVMGIEMYLLKDNDVSVLGEGWYKTVSDSDSNGEIQHIEKEIYYSSSGIYSNGKWTFVSDERIYTVADTESEIGTLTFYNAERSDHYLLNEYLNDFYLGDFSVNYDYSAMVSDGMATIGAETLDGRECTTYSVFDNDNKLIRKMWVDNQTGIIFKRYGYTVIDDKENTSTYEYTTTLTLLSGQEAPKMPDYSTALFTNKIYSDSEWTDDMLISPSVVKAENFDSFEIAVYSDTLATFAFYGENVGLADNPEELPGYVSLGDGSTYRFYDEQTGESFTLNVNYGDNGYGIKILYIQIELNVSVIK